MIGSIEVSADKTLPGALLRLIDSREGQPFDASRWAGDVQRLKNTEIFYEVVSSTRDAGGRQALRVDVKNKFSLIPIFKFKQGGGTSLLTAGAYEVNFLKRYLELGAQYENMNGKNGFVAWFRHPYLFSRRNRFGTEIYVHTINLPLLTFRGHEEAHFDNEEIRWNARLEREWTDKFRSGIEIGLYNNHFLEDNGTPGKAARNRAFVAARPLHPGFTASVSPSLRFWRLNYDRFYVEGNELSLKGEFAHRSFGSEFDFARGELQYLGGYRPWRKVNLAAQFRIGSKSGREFQHKFYLGGLDSVRGFLDGQFRGEHLWLGNLEVRPTLLERKLWVLQGNFFTDWSKTWDSTHFAIDGFADPFISYGTGFRVILTRIYRAVLRVDLAWTQEPVRQFGFSLGLQQFF